MCSVGGGGLSPPSLSLYRVTEEGTWLLFFFYVFVYFTGGIVSVSAHFLIFYGVAKCVK